jgi:sulfur carrier protein
MDLTLNGEPRAVAGTTVADLVAELGLAGRAVAVEVNRQVVPRREHETTPLRDGDSIEVVTLVGGG